jgi:hypothetical protein
MAALLLFDNQLPGPICPLSVVSRPLHLYLQLTTDHGQLTIPVTFSFRVSVGIEVIPGRMIRIESVIDPEDQALDR